ncbi:MAG: flagellar biosynthesis protein FlhB [Parvularculaceae bacterium]
MSDAQQNEGEDKSHDPTPQKIRKSREKGDVPYSSEVTTAATYGAFFLALFIFAGWSATNISAQLALFLQRPEDFGAALTTPGSDAPIQDLFARLVVAAAPLFLFLALATILSLVGQQAIAWGPSKIKPKLSRISIVSNAKQKYGPNGLFEFLKSAIKLTAIMAVLLIGFKDRFVELPALSALPAKAFPTVMLRESVFFIGLITITAVGIAAIDLPWRRHQHHKKLMMTFQELKKENKETEGDPEMKGARRDRAKTLATNRMMSDVPKSDVVIVNPTHYAVALAWDREQGAAPVCVAKGVDEIAARIREAAATAGVPIRRDPPTARSIYAVVDIGKEIKKEHYAAVAAAIHYADQIQKKSKEKYSP